MNSSSVPQHTRGHGVLGPLSSSTETTSNNPGAGRILGNIYSATGKLLEYGLHKVTERLGYGPSAQIRAPCSSADTIDSTETMSNNPGAGRNLGNFYSIVGKRLNNGMSMVAVRLGYGPRATAVRIHRLLLDEDIGPSSRERKVAKAGRRLVAYTRYALFSIITAYPQRCGRSHVPSTQEHALDEIIDLSCRSEYFRRSSREAGIRTLGLQLQSSGGVWGSRPRPIQTRLERAFVTLADGHAYIKDLVWSLRSQVISKSWPFIRKELRECLLYVGL